MGQRTEVNTGSKNKEEKKTHTTRTHTRAPKRNSRTSPKARAPQQSINRASEGPPPSPLTTRASDGPVCCSFPFSQSCTARQWLSSWPTLASRDPFSLNACFKKR